jgi:hypothetical protein
VVQPQKSILSTKHHWSNTNDNSGFFSTSIAECETGDENYAYLDSGSCRLIPYEIGGNTTFISFSGSRISKHNIIS